MAKVNTGSLTAGAGVCSFVNVKTGTAVGQHSTLRLPGLYARDAQQRGVPIGTVVRESDRWVWVTINPHDLHLLTDDALYYAGALGDSQMPDDQDVCRSAAATLRVTANG